MHHENPGAPFEGTVRSAFLPDTREGRRLLTRFKYAFCRGLMFDVGTSETTGMSDVVVWSRRVPQKSNLQGGPAAFGYPDPRYLDVANDALDRLMVPSADDALAALALVLGDDSNNNNNNATNTNTSDPHAVRDGEILRYDAPASIVDEDATTAAPPPPAGTTTTASAPSQPPTPDADAAASVSNTDDDLDGIDEECPICFDALSSLRPAVRIKSCRHAYHESCVRQALEHEPKCPICRTIVGEPRGKCPSGTMTVRRCRARPAPGFDDSFINSCSCSGGTTTSGGSFEIDYDIPDGIQHAFHDEPNRPFQGTYRKAYLPDTPDGVRLLARLKYAFRRGLTFRVGTSLTTGAQNVVTWASIHHKTSMYGGTHGYPDPNYLSNCNGSLDALGVPDADACLDYYTA